MKKISIRKITSVLLSILLIAVMIPFAVSAAEYDAEEATVFTFTDSGITASEGKYSDYSIKGTALSITGSGTYVITGSCSDGSVTVKKGVTGVVLILDGITLTCKESAPIACNKSSEVTIVAADGSVNTLADTEYNNDETYTDNTNAENAVIKCKDGSKVTVCGTGTLNINAYGKNGIKSGSTTEAEGEAWLTVKELTLNITATVNDALNAEQLLNVESGNITINAADDAVHSDLILNIGSETTSPVINIESCVEGIEGATVNIYSGDITINATDDTINAANSDLTDYSFSINITGGKIYAYTSEGDGIDSNGTLNISGGIVEVWSANTADNQPIDADGKINISGGTVIAAGGSSGMSINVENNQPYIVVGSSAMGGGQPGQPGGEQPGQPGEDMPEPPGGEQPGQPGEDMPEPPGGDRPEQPGEDRPDQPGGDFPGGGQSGVSISKGSSVIIKDSNGNTLYSTSAKCSASYIFFSCPSMTAGSTYTVSSSGSQIASATAQGSADYVPTSTFTDITIGGWYEEAALWCNENGYMTGTGEKTFSPNVTLTRAMFVQILARIAGADLDSIEYSGRFNDVTSSDWYAKAVQWAIDNGITEGTGEKTFSPNEPVTREQLAVFLYAYAEYMKYDTSTIAELDKYTDTDEISSWAVTAIKWAVAEGLISGTSETTVSPKSGATRAQAAVIFKNFVEIYVAEQK